jgi:hypothetical protein
MKKTLLFCNGISCSGKSHFIRKTLPSGLFYNLRSATTRPMRKKESEGNPYFFRTEEYFQTTPLATHLWVNRAFWTPEKPKWLYGIPETEIFEHIGENMVYDVIQPQYTRQLIDWFKKQGLDKEYDFKIAYFLSPDNSLQKAAERANMPDDLLVRQTNTCNPIDFYDAGLSVDFILSPRAGIISKDLLRYIDRVKKQQSQKVY